MSNEKSEKFTLVTTHKKNRRDTPFVQGEGEFTEMQWEAIVDGLMKLINLYTRCKEELTIKQKQDKFIASATQKRLTEAQLEVIAGEGIATSP